MLCPHFPQKRMCGGYAPPQRRQTRSAWGGSEAGVTAAPLGYDFGTMLSPHRPQNLEFSGSGDEHLGHGNIFDESPAVTTVNDRLPHRPQNFTPSAKRE
jgi:hypothetical protein